MGNEDGSPLRQWVKNLDEGDKVNIEQVRQVDNDMNHSGSLEMVGGLDGLALRIGDVSLTFKVSELEVTDVMSHGET